MNAGRPNNGWILCPSKTFPNKLYYFNVLTGEAAWSLNDVEKRAMSKSFFNPAENWQNYPEPDSPPADASWSGFRTGLNYRPYTTHVFGQAAFPKYTPNIDQSVVWAPVQVPMSRSFDQFQHWSDRTMQNQFVRFENQNHPNVGFGHDDSMRNWTGFDGYQMERNRTVFGQKPQNKIFSQAPTLGQRFGPTSNTCHIPKQVAEPIFGRPRTKSESQVYHNNSIFNSKSSENRTNLEFLDFATLSPQKRTNQMLPNIQNRHNQRPYQHENNNFMSKSLENLTLFDDEGIPPRKQQLFYQSKHSNLLFNSQTLKNHELRRSEPDISTRKINPFAESKRYQNTPANDFKIFDNNKVCKSSIQHTQRNTQSQNLSEIDTTDLRYILMAKKRKSDNNVTSKSGNFEAKKISTMYRNVERNEDVTPKKRVTFDLGVETDQEETVSIENDHQDLDICKPSENLNISSLSKLADPSVNTDHWYIVVDTEVLLDDFEFVENFVQSDGKCTLLIPHAVRVEIDAMSLGDCRGRQRVMTARQLSRRLATLPHYITVESPQNIEENNESPSEEDIVNSCLRVMSENYHVVLLTNNEELYDKAKSVDIHCYRLQEIKDGDVAKPEVSFELKKIQKGLKQIDVKEKNNNLSLQFSNPSNPFASSKDFPVNCFRKRLFDCVNTENNVAQLNTDTNRQTDNHKNYDTPNFHENQQLTIFPPKNLTSQRKCIFEDENEILNLNLKLKTFEIQTDRNATRLADKEMASEKENLFLKQATSTPKHTANGMKIKSINGYTIEAHLKKFYVKNKVVEDRLMSRMDEWVCSFTQILDDTLTEILQNNTAPITNNLSPPWSLLEALECLAELYGDHTSIKIIVDKLAALLFSGNTENGKLLRTMKPNDFMKILGCGILLVKYLKSILPPSPTLAESDQLLESLHQSIEEPTVPPDLVLTVHTPVLSRSEVHNAMEERRNFIKNPSDVLDYLKKHFPEWRSYSEVTDSVNTKEKEQLLSKPKQCTKVVRTCGKNLNLLKLDSKKTIKFNPVREKLKSPELEDHITKPCTEKTKVNQTKEPIPKKDQTKDRGPKLDETKKTGPTLLRNLALNSLSQNKIPKMKEIDIEKRENVNKDLLKMIDEMTSPGITKYYDIDSIIVRKADEQTDDLNTTKHGNTFTQHSKEGLKVVRKFDVPFAFKKPLDVKQKLTIETNKINEPILKKNKTEESQAEAKNDGPKVIRSIKLIDAFEEKIRKIPDEKLDLDVLDYNGVDEDSVSDVSQTYTIDDEDDDSQKLIKSNELAICNETVKVSAENNDTAAENNDIAVTNDNSAENNDSLDGCASTEPKDNEISDAIYPFVHSFFSGLSNTYQFIFDFIQTTLNQYDDEITNEKKIDLYEKAMNVFLLLTHITEQLKSIIERETNAATLKDIFKTSSDTRMSRYRQVIIKCLEQAQILQNALKVLLTLTNDNFDVYSNSYVSNIQYSNIFE